MKGAEDLGVAVLLRVEVQHEIDDGALKPRGQAHVDVEARAGELHAPLEIKDAHLHAQVVVGLGREGEFRLFAPGAHHRVVLFIPALRDRFVEEIGHAEMHLVEFCVEGVERIGMPLDLVGDPLHLFH